MDKYLFAALSLCGLNIFCGLISSIQAPFYPIAASKVGATASLFGPVFGMVQLATCISSPVIGGLESRIGLRKMLKVGLVILNISTISFGLLAYIKSTTTFLVVSYILRFVEGVGSAALWISTLSLLLSWYPGKSGLVYSVVEATFGLGYTIGPVFGAPLYQWGGFMLPFMFCGIGLLVTGVISVVKVQPLMNLSYTEIVNESEIETDDILSSNQTAKSSYSLLFGSLSIGVSLLSATAGGFAIGYLESMLELHLETFSLQVTSIALCFLSFSLSYTPASLILGWLTDKRLEPWTVCTCGMLLILVSSMLIGPVPFLPISPSLPLTLVSLILQGIGCGAVVVCSYTCVLQSFLDKPGCSENMSTYSLVSGLWTSFYAFGNFLGPTVAGPLYDLVGFRWGTVSVQFCSGVSFLLNITIMLLKK